MKCAICKLEVREGQKIAQCPHCLATFHDEHYNDWLKDESICPVCSREIKSSNDTSISDSSSNETPFFRRDNYTDVQNEKQLHELQFYKRLGIHDVPKKVILQFIMRNNPFKLYIDKKSRKLHILKKRNYYAFNLPIKGIGIPLTFLGLMFPIFALIFSLLVHRDPTKIYSVLILCIIGIIIIIYSATRFAISLQKLSKQWVVIGFRNDSVNIISTKTVFDKKTIITIPIQEVAEFELGSTSMRPTAKKETYTKEKMVSYLVIKTKDEKKYFLGEVFTGRGSHSSNFVHNFDNFIKENYKVPLVLSNTKYQKRRKQVGVIYIVLSVVYFLSTVVSYILNFIFVNFS